MFGEKNSAAIYLDRNKIIFADPENEAFAELPLEKDIFNHLEVTNSEKFVQVVKTFFDQFPAANGALFLAKKILFEREIESDGKEGADTDTAVQKFLSMVPVAKSKLGSKVMVGEGSVLCLAVNKEYYQLVIKSAELSGKKISAVVPAFMFENLEHDGVFAADGVTDALSDKSLFEQSNFLDSNTSELPVQSSEHSEKSNEAPTAETQSNTKTVILTLVLIGLLSFSVIFSYMNGLFDRFLPGKTVVNSSPMPAMSAEVNPTMDTIIQDLEATVSGVKMEDLRAKITNGTGVSGQATKAQDALAPLKMKETLLDPVASKGATITEIGYDPEVPKDLVDQVSEILSKIFTKVEEKEATDTGEFDFIILTGKEKP